MTKIIQIFALCLFATFTAVANDTFFAASEFTAIEIDSTDIPLSISGNITALNTKKPLPNCSIKVLNGLSRELLANSKSDNKGNFRMSLIPTEEYLVMIDVQNHFSYEKEMTGAELASPLNVVLKPKPGYLFDVTVFDSRRVSAMINLVDNARVEIYNNTTREEELVIAKNPKAGFNFSFKEGNHYTVLVRREGYLNRRIQIFVDIDGCILCVKGMGVEQPNVTEIMTSDNEIGYLLGNIALDTIEIGNTFEIENIYYDYDKSDIRPDAAEELDKLVVFLRDNPAINVELGAHTDSRGSDSYNMALSGRRAASAVEYIITQGKVSDSKIESKGYGEEVLVNHCSNGVTCSAEEHQENRRTEITITGYDNSDPLNGASLKQLIEDPNIYEKMLEKRRRENLLIKDLKKNPNP